MYKKLKPLACVCGSDSTEFDYINNDTLRKSCLDCKNVSLVKKDKYFEEFDEWLEYRLNILNKLFSQNQN